MIQASGLASGVDTRSLTAQLVNVERIPLNRLEARKVDYSRQISRLGSFSSALSDFQSKLEDFKSSETLLSMQATSSDESSVSVTASGSARSGSWEIEVDSLAKAQRERSTAFGSADDEVQAGTISLEVWGEDAVDVEITEGMTLTDVRDAIRASDADVTASILTVDSGTYLSITSNKTGHDPDAGGPGLTITESYAAGGGGASGQQLGLTTDIASQNAVMTIDGEQVTSTSNSVSDAIEGVTFNLKSESAEAFTVSVQGDASTVKDRAKELVDSYNAVYRQAGLLKNEDNRFGTNAMNALRTAFTSAVEGTEIPNLASIGITTSKDTGGLVFNESAFETALEKNPDAIVELFGQEDTGIVARMDAMVERYTDSFDGLIKNNTDTWRRRIDSADDSIARGEARIERFEARMNRQFSAMEQIINSLNDASNRFASLMPPQIIQTQS